MTKNQALQSIYIKVFDRKNVNCKNYTSYIDNDVFIKSSARSFLQIYYFIAICWLFSFLNIAKKSDITEWEARFQVRSIEMRPVKGLGFQFQILYNWLWITFKKCRFALITIQAFTTHHAEICFQTVSWGNIGDFAWRSLGYFLCCCFFFQQTHKPRLYSVWITVGGDIISRKKSDGVKDPDYDAARWREIVVFSCWVSQVRSSRVVVISRVYLYWDHTTTSYNENLVVID